MSWCYCFLFVSDNTASAVTDASFVSFISSGCVGPNFQEYLWRQAGHIWRESKRWSCASQQTGNVRDYHARPENQNRSNLIYYCLQQVLTEFKSKTFSLSDTKTRTTPYAISIYKFICVYMYLNWFYLCRVIPLYHSSHTTGLHRSISCAVASIFL